ncbi:MAG: hypothetical protein KGL39_24145 [Patescibacteria group bacterium]|nr:hypothetical protein [Patescibacteria group bacterium]
MTQVSGIVAAPSNTSVPDGTINQGLLQGKQGEALNAELHGFWYTQAYRGNLFWGATATAGTTIPIQASGLAGTFVLLNPANSGKNLELVRYTAAFEAATMVVSDVSLYYQTNIGSVNAALSSLTALTPHPGNLGGSFSPQGALYSAATFTGALTRGLILFGPGATTSTNNLALNYDFNGMIIVPPGCAVTTAGNAAQTSAASQAIVWVENPL